MPVPYCFDYCSFVICFEVRKCETSKFVVLFQDYLAIWFPLKVSMNFRLDFSISEKNAFGILIEIVLNCGLLRVVLTFNNSKSSKLNTNCLSIICVFSNFFQ